MTHKKSWLLGFLVAMAVFLAPLGLWAGEGGESPPPGPESAPAVSESSSPAAEEASTGPGVKTPEAPGETQAPSDPLASPDQEGDTGQEGTSPDPAPISPAQEETQPLAQAPPDPDRPEVEEGLDRDHPEEASPQEAEGTPPRPEGQEEPALTPDSPLEPEGLTPPAPDREESWEALPSEGPSLPGGKEDPVLEEGTLLDPAHLGTRPMVFSSSPMGMKGAKGNQRVEVDNFDALKAAIENTGTTPITIVVTKSFELREVLTIKAGQNIILTAQNNKKADGAWDPIKQPADYADQGEAKQREIIEEAQERGEEALAKTQEALPSKEKDDIILTRAASFVHDSLFKVLGALTLGTAETALYIDDNKEVKTKLSTQGVVFDVGNKGELTMDNAVIMNVDNLHGYTGPIKVHSGGTFTMNGGRISHNSSYEQVDLAYSRPTSAGAIYVNPGGTFTMNNGLIDNNKGNAGGVLAGDLFGSSGNPAVINMKGGILAKNQGVSGYNGYYALGGGISGFPKYPKGNH